jgi:arylsulfatase A-like enzyme
MDLTASFLQLAGAKPPSGVKLDGIDILDQLRRGGTPTARTLYWRKRRGEQTWRGVRDGDLKLVSRQDGDQRQDWLFDLASDVAEKSDLSGSRPADFKRLSELLSKWEIEVKPSR